MHVPEGFPLEHHLEGGQLVQSSANLREASNPSRFHIIVWWSPPHTMKSLH